MVKKIELEVQFDDAFMPSKNFDEPCRKNNWKSECEKRGCPFFGCDDVTGYGWCNLDVGVVKASRRCPIRKYFETGEEES